MSFKASVFWGIVQGKDTKMDISMYMLMSLVIICLQNVKGIVWNLVPQYF